MASKKTNLVISYSLYHLWLDFQLPIDGSENDLILIGDFPEIESLYSSAKSVLKKRFQRILILPGVHSSRNKFLFKIQNLRNSQKIRSFLTKKHYHNLFFHHDKRLETQTAIHIAEKNNVNVISNFVEDGLAHYIDERIPPNAFRERFLKTIFPSLFT